MPEVLSYVWWWCFIEGSDVILQVRVYTIISCTRSEVQLHCMHSRMLHLECSKWVLGMNLTVDVSE